MSGCSVRQAAPGYRNNSSGEPGGIGNNGYSWLRFLFFSMFSTFLMISMHISSFMCICSIVSFNFNTFTCNIPPSRLT